MPKAITARSQQIPSTTKPRRKPFTGEIAPRADDLYRNWSGTPYNPDLLAIKKGGLSIYQTMKRDDQVKPCLALKKSVITTPGYNIVGEDEEQCEFIEYAFATIDGTMSEFLISMLSAMEYGFSIHEKIYRYIDIGEYRGNIGLQRLKAKSPTRITFDTDEYGNLKPNGILQKLDTGIVLKLPVDKFVVYSYQKEFDNYYGESDLRAAYKPWFVKDNVLRYMAIYLERFSVPIIKGRVASGRVTDPQREDFKKIVQNVQSGMSVLTPPDLVMELLESARTDRSVFREAIDMLNTSIARAVLVPQLIGFVPQQNTGSYGKSETELDVFFKTLKTVTESIQEAINEQIIKDLIDKNYGPQDQYPLFEIKPLREDDKSKIVAAFSEAVARGAVIPTKSADHKIRELLNFPDPEDEEESDDIEEKLDDQAKANAGMGPGNSGLAGATSKVGNAPGMGNQYARDHKLVSYSDRVITGPEARADWERYVAELDNIEAESRKALSDAFEHTIYALVKDAKKN